MVGHPVEVVSAGVDSSAPLLAEDGASRRSKGGRNSKSKREVKVRQRLEGCHGGHHTWWTVVAGLCARNKPNVSHKHTSKGTGTLSVAVLG
jgi:hypothetical protein